MWDGNLVYLPGLGAASDFGRHESAREHACMGRARRHAPTDSTLDCPPSHALARHTIEAHLGIKAGETSKDGNFTLTEVECLGACVNAPMVQINDMFFENLTPESTIALLDNLKDGRPVKIG